MIKLIMLTGFLGSGKTTLLQRLLEGQKDKKIGVIVNEFGSVNIDARLLKTSGDIRIAELSNGSIFCACIKDNFVDSLIEMSGYNLDYLLIEASGLADPASMEGILQGIAHKTGDGYHNLGSVCIIDAENFQDLSELLPAIESQIEYASVIIINKTDLVDEDSLVETENQISKWNDRAVKIRTTFCQVDIEDLISAMDASGPAPAARESSNTWKNRANTFVVHGTEIVKQEDLEAFLKYVVNDSYRIKGFAVTDKGNVEISAVGDHIQINSWGEPLEKTEIVLISSVGFGMVSTITDGLDKHMKGKLSL